MGGMNDERRGAILDANYRCVNHADGEAALIDCPTLRQRALGPAILSPQKRLAVTGIDGSYFQTLQSFDAGLRRRHVVHDGVERGLPGVLEQIAAEEIAGGGQNSDRAGRVPGQVQHLRVAAIGQ